MPFFEPIPVVVPSVERVSDPEERLMAIWAHVTADELRELVEDDPDWNWEVRAIRRRVLAVKDSRRPA